MVFSRVSFTPDRESFHRVASADVERDIEQAPRMLIACLQPCHRRFQLITARLARPLWLVIERLLFRQFDHGMKRAIAQKIERERQRGVLCAGSQLAASLGCPRDCGQSARKR